MRMSDIQQRYEQMILISRLDEIEKRLDEIVQRLNDRDRDFISMCKSSFELDSRMDDVVQALIEIGAWKEANKHGDDEI